MSGAALDRPVRILAFCGSLRAGSYNQALLDTAAALAADAGADVTEISLAHFPAPLYSANIQNERGIPIGIQQLRTRIAAADALMIGTPEYNAGYSPLIKNTIDWLSRLDRHVILPHLVGVLTASPGGHGGSSNREQLAKVVAKMFATMHDESFGLPKMRDKIVDGELTDPAELARLQAWVDGYVAGATSHAGDPPQIPTT